MNTVVFIRTKRSSQRNAFLLLFAVIFMVVLSLAFPEIAYADDGETNTPSPVEVVQSDQNDNPINDSSPQEDVANISIDSGVEDSSDSASEDTVSRDTEAEAEQPQDEEGTDAQPQEETVDSAPADIVQPEDDEEVPLDQIVSQEEQPVSDDSVLSDDGDENTLQEDSPSSSLIIPAEDPEISANTSHTDTFIEPVPDPYFTIGTDTYRFLPIGGTCPGGDKYCDTFTTPIQEAINYVKDNTLTPDGNTVFIETGIYNEDITIDSFSQPLILKSMLGDVTLNGTIMISNNTADITLDTFILEGMITLNNNSADVILTGTDSVDLINVTLQSNKAANLIVNGGGNKDTLNLTGDTSANKLTLSITDVEKVNLQADSGNDDVTVNIKGNDPIDISADGGSGNTDMLTINGDDLPNDLTISTLNFETVAISMGAGDDRVDIKNASGVTSFTLDGGSNDLITYTAGIPNTYGDIIVVSGVYSGIQEVFKTGSLQNVESTDIFGLVRVVGTFSFNISPSTQTIYVSDKTNPTTNTPVNNVDLYTFIFTGVSTFLGYNGVGLALTGVDLALAFWFENNPGNRKWVSVMGNVGSASFAGVDGLTLDLTSVQVQVNKAASDGTVVDYAQETGNKTILEISSPSIQFTMDGEKGELAQVIGQADINLFNVLTVTGEFSLKKLTGQTAVLSDQTSVPVDILTLGMANLDIFVGSGEGADRIGVTLSQVDLVLAVFYETGGTRIWTAAKALAGAISLVGIAGLDIPSVEGVGFEANKQAEDGSLIDFNVILDEPETEATELVVEVAPGKSVTFDMDDNQGDYARVTGITVGDGVGLVAHLIISGLEKVGLFGNEAGTTGAFIQSLPVIGDALKNIDLEGSIAALSNAVDAYLSDTETYPDPSVDGLIAYLQAQMTGASGSLTFGGVTISGSYATVDGVRTLTLGVDYSTHASISIPLELDSAFIPGLIDLGIDFQTAGNLDLLVTIAIGLDFGYDFTNGTFFTRLRQLEANAQVSATDAAATLTLGFITGGVTEGEIDLNANLTVSVTDPTDSDDYLTFTDLGTILADLGTYVSVTSHGDLTATLPIMADIAGFDVASQLDSQGAAVTITDSELFDTTLPQVSTNLDFDSILKSFTNLTPASVVKLLKDIANLLDSLSQSEFLQVVIPFTDGTRIGDVLQFGAAFGKEISTFLTTAQLTAIESLADLTDFTLAQDAVFTLSIDGADILVTIAADSTTDNTSLDDLLGDLQVGLDAALAANGLAAGLVIFGRTQDTLLISSQMGSGISELQLSAEADDPVVTKLGFEAAMSGKENGDPVFSGLAALSTLLSDLLDPFDVLFHYDAAANELSFTLSLDYDFTAFELPINFDYDLGGFAGISTSSMLSLTASVGLTLTVVMDLDPDTVPVIVSNPITVSNGILNDKASFRLTVNTTTLDVLVARDDTNTKVEDLVLDIQNALDAALEAGGFAAGDVVAYTLGGILGLRGGEGRGINSLRFNADPDSTAISELAFEDGSIGRAQASTFYLENVHLEGSLTLATDDLSLSASLAFFNVSSTGSSGSISLGLALDLVDPEKSDPENKRVSLVDLWHHSDTISDYIQFAVEDDASFNLTNITTDPDIVGLFLAGEGNTAYVNIVFSNWFTDPSEAPVVTTNIQPRFSDMGWADIVRMVSSAADMLASVQGLGFLSYDLPVIDVSLVDIFDYASQFADFADYMSANPAGALQDIEGLMKGWLGLASDSNLVSLTLDTSNGGTAIKLAFTWDTGWSGVYPLNLDLATLLDGLDIPGLSGLSSFVGFNATANLGVEVGVLATFVLGLELADGSTPRPFIYDGATGTRIDLTFRAFAGDLNFTANIAIMQVTVKEGSAVIDADGLPDTDAPAVIRLMITPKEDGSRHYLSDLGLIAGDVALTVTAGASVLLPIYFPTDTIPLGSPDDLNGDGYGDNVLAISIPDLMNIFTNGVTVSGGIIVVTPDISSVFDSFRITIPTLLKGPAALLDGLDMVLNMAQMVVDAVTSNLNLPMIGDYLSTGLNFLQTMKVNLMTMLSSIFVIGFDETLFAQDPLYWVKQALFAALYPGLLKLKDENNDGKLDYRDILTVSDDPTGCTDASTWCQLNLNLGQEFGVDLQTGFDIGVPGLGLEMENGGVHLTIGWDFVFNFGIDLDQGFYFDTSDASELEIYARASLPSGFKATGTLFFLKAELTDAGSELEASITLDLLDPSGEGRLGIMEIARAVAQRKLSDVFVAEFTVVADINLNVRLSLDGLAAFPELQADFFLDWELGDPDPTFGFKNIRMNLASFVKDFAYPVLKQVMDVIEPLDFLIGPQGWLLTVEPLSSYLLGQDVTILDAMEMLAKAKNDTAVLNGIKMVRAFIDAANTVRDLYEMAESLLATDEAWLILGSVTFTRINGSFVASFTPAFTAGGQGSQIDVLPNPALKDFLTSANANAVCRVGCESLTKRPFLLAFPILSDPMKLLSLFTGKGDVVTFVTVQFPTLGTVLRLPIEAYYGPVKFGVYGTISIAANIAMGYDSFGMQAMLNGGDWTDLFDGFYISARANADGTGADTPELTVKLALEVGAELNILLARAYGAGGMYGTINFNLNDPNRDGKVRYREILANICVNIACVFDIDGKLEWGFKFGVELCAIGCTTIYEKDLGGGTIYEFDYTCTREPVLATRLKDEQGVEYLQLNMGESAAARIHGDITDGDESFIVSGSAASVTVSAFGKTQIYTNINKIVARMGLGNDSLDMIGLIGVASEIHGGAGDDKIICGSGNDTVYGDEGADTIWGGNGNDLLYGGLGNDKLYGQAGDDTLYGGAGNDTLNGGDGSDKYIFEDGWGADSVSDASGTDTLDCSAVDAAVTFTFDGTNFTITDNGNTVSASGVQIETFIGGASNDTFKVQSVSYAITIKGHSGTDWLLGTLGDDIFAMSGLNAGTLNGALSFSEIKNLDGRSGNDTLSYAAYATTVNIILSGTGAADGFKGYASDLSGSFTNFNAFTGGSGTTDAFTSTDLDSTFEVYPGDDFYVAGGNTARLSAFEGFTGGAGKNTLDYSVYGSAISASLDTVDASGASGTATGVSKFSNIDILIGSTSNADKLLGTASDDTFAMSGLNAGTVNGKFIFSGIENLDGRGGNDTLSYAAYATQVDVTLSGTGTTDGFSGAATDLTGTFVNFNIFTSGSGTTDIFTGADLPSSFEIHADDPDIYSAAGRTAKLFAFEHYTGGAGANTLDYSLFEGPVTITLSDTPCAHGFAGTGSGISGIFTNMDILVVNPDTDMTFIGSNLDATFEIHDFEPNLYIAGGCSFQLINVDNYVGGSGRDTLDYHIFTLSGVVVDLSTGFATGVGGFISGIENIIGSALADQLTGDSNPNEITGGGGDDQLNGLAGDDTYHFADGWGSDTLVDSDGVDTLDFSPASSNLDVDLPNTLITDASSNSLVFSGIETIYTGSGADIFHISGTQEYDLYSNSGADEFLFADCGTLAGLINSGSGPDVLDYTGCALPLEFRLDEMDVNGFSGMETSTLYAFAGINRIISGSALDTLLGLDLNADFAIHAGNAADVFYPASGMTLQTASIENLVSGSGDDTFTFDDGATVNALDGGSGYDTLDLGAYSTVHIILTGIGNHDGFAGVGPGTGTFTNINNILGTINSGDRLTGYNGAATFELGGSDHYCAPDCASGPTLDLSGFEILSGGSGKDAFQIIGDRTYDLLGGAGDDTFHFADNATLTGLLDGGFGNNTLDYSAYTTARNIYLIWLDTYWGFRGMEASLNGTFDNITNLIGTPVIDTLNGLDRSAFWTITGTASGNYFAWGYTIYFSSIEALKGGNGQDGFIIKNRVSFVGSIDGGGGIDTLNLSEATYNLYIDLTTGKVQDTTNRIILIRSGMSGIENILAGSGNDYLIGDDNVNFISGGAGNDWIEGRGNNDNLSGGLGNDHMIGGSGDDILNGDAGKDYLDGSTGNDRIWGGVGNDKLLGGDDNDYLRGNEGSDRILGGAGNDKLIGDTGKDNLNGGTGNDRLIGGADNDRLLGRGGKDKLNGGSGADYLVGNAGYDIAIRDGLDISVLSCERILG